MYKVELPTAYGPVTIFFNTNLSVFQGQENVYVDDGLHNNGGYKIVNMKYEDVVAAIDKAIKR